MHGQFRQPGWKGRLPHTPMVCPLLRLFAAIRNWHGHLREEQILRTMSHFLKKCGQSICRARCGGRRLPEAPGGFHLCRTAPKHGFRRFDRRPIVVGVEFRERIDDFFVNVDFQGARDLQCPPAITASIEVLPHTPQLEVV